MASRRSAQSLAEAFHGLTLTPAAQPGRVAGLASRILSSSPSPLASSSPRRTTSSASPLPRPTRRLLSTSVPAASASAPPQPASSVSSVVGVADRLVPVTVLAFPSLEPRALEMWPAQHLHLPLRRDLLHLAVVYEGDNTRQGTASSKTRYEVHGSHRKMRPQKGSGRARVGSRQSPLLRGGGKTFGPHPRDFGTDLNRKMYDRAWRTALSYRYRRGELFVCEDGMELPLPDTFLRLAQRGTLDRAVEDGFVRRYVRTLLNGSGREEEAAAEAAGTESGRVTGITRTVNGGIGSIGQAWGRAAGRTTFITTDRRPNLFTSLETASEDGRALTLDDVDVKDLLETGRIVIERAALQEMLAAHQSDLVSRVVIHGARSTGPSPARVVVA